MTSYLIMLLLATGFFYNHTQSLSNTSLQDAATNADSKKDAKQNQAKADAIPKWLRKVIQELEAAGPENTTARIIRYKYRNGFVYFLEAKCCDMFNSVYDTNGKRICSTGGVHGGGDGKCGDFYSARQDEKVIWKDKKER